MIVGRFMTGVRIVVTPLAAESGMPYLRYVAFDVLGAGLLLTLAPAVTIRLVGTPRAERKPDDAR